MGKIYATHCGHAILEIPTCAFVELDTCDSCVKAGLTPQRLQVMQLPSACAVQISPLHLNDSGM